MDRPSKTLTLLMNEASEGQRSAADRLLPLVYDELRKLAGAKLKNEPKNLTLQATALVHEAYLRLGGSEEVKWQSRRHYFAAAAEAMRRILIARARRVAGPKAGGGLKRHDAAELNVSTEDDPARWLALDEGLKELAAYDPELAELVSLKFFAGLSVDQIAAALEVSPRTVDNHWKVARAFLSKHMNSQALPGSAGA